MVKYSTNCPCANLSITLDSIGSKEMGLLLQGFSGSPDLGTGTTSAVFQDFAKVLEQKELFIILVMEGSVFGRLSLSTLAETLSIPGALLGGMFLTTCSTSFSDTIWN